MAFRIPLNNYTISQGFGANPQYYQQFGQKGHNGLDLAAPAGTPVYAADEGTVAFEGWGQNHSWMGKIAGICIIINHVGSYAGYAHLASTVVNKGQKVGKGQLIGYVGATGTATGPHLHFEMLPLSPNFSNGYAGRIDVTPFIESSNLATAEQVKLAYREILEREADANGLAHYQKYPIGFVREDLARSQEKRNLDARKAEAARVAAEQAAAEAARRAEESTKAAEAKKAQEAALKAEQDRLAAEAELARVAEEERVAREAAEAKAKEQQALEQKAKELKVTTTAEAIQDINDDAQEVLNANEFAPVINDHVKTIAYFATDVTAVVSALVFTILAIFGIMDAIIAITTNAAVATAMLGIKQTFRLSAKKQ